MIYTYLTVAYEYDVEVAIHTDTLNKVSYVEDTICMLLLNIALFILTIEKGQEEDTHQKLLKCLDNLMFGHLSLTRLVSTPSTP
jgi:hypothetical protein